MTNRLPQNEGLSFELTIIFKIHVANQTQFFVFLHKLPYNHNNKLFWRRRKRCVTSAVDTK